MLRLTAIILSSIILLQSVSFSSSVVVELGNFVEHYNFHKETQEDSFVEFVSKHYGELKQQHHKEHPSEHEDHEQLPFHSSSATSVLIAVLNNQQVDTNLNDYSSGSYLNNFRYVHGISSFNPLDLVQPPIQA